MDPNMNPFSPGAGSPPPELAGRDEVLDHAMLALKRIKHGRSERSLFLIGLRGVGKTVLLNEIEKRANKENYLSAMIEASEDKSLPALLAPHLRRLLIKLNVGVNVSAKARTAMRVFKSFLGNFKFEVGEMALSISADSEEGTGDSGDLEADLTDLFVSLSDRSMMGRFCF